MFEKIFKKVIFGVKIVDLLLGVFNFVMLFSLRICWSGISKKLGYEDNYSDLLYNLPVIVCAVTLALLITNIVLIKVMKKESKVWALILLPLHIAFFVVNMVIIKLGAIDYMYFVWPWFFLYLGLIVLVLAILAFIFIYPNTKLKDSKIFKYSCLSAVLLLTGIKVFDVSFNSIEHKPVVYAVEDEYQIVFTSHTHARGWVEIDGVRYFDNYAGSNEGNSKIHKVHVPMEVLDEHKAYTVHTQKITYRGPFGGYMGRDISESYTFKPVNVNDGFSYYVLSDVHEAFKAATKTASYASDMELLILAGDISSMLEWDRDLFAANDLAYSITKGQLPVVYARGNHELKGKKAEDLHKVVGAKNEDFYYSFTLSDEIYGVVLDIGEDHEDDYWEYYDTAVYDDYRDEQIKFLQNELDTKDLSLFKYKMAICHIPLTFVNTRHNHVEFKTQATELLNQMGIDISVSGHQHDLFVFEPDTVTPGAKLTYNTDYLSSGKTIKAYVTDASFPSLLVSKRGYTQTDDVPLQNMKSQIGVKVSVDFTNNTQTCVYNNSKGEKINMVNPFYAKTYGEEIVFTFAN